MSPQWYFDEVEPGTMERNPVSEEFFTNGTRLEAVIRESLQNSLDATDGGNDPVEVRIYFSGDEDKKKIQRILDLLDEDDDVQAVYHNWDDEE